MTEPLVLLDIADNVAWVTLNDPTRLNAISTAMVEELTSALKKAESGARVVVLTGAGKGFCSGANLAGGTPASLGDDGKVDGGAVLESHFNPLMRTIRGLNIPVITAVRGAAAGVGASIALSGDIIIATEGAFFLQAFRRIGLVPDGGSPYILTRAIGRVRAMELMLLGERLPAPKALEWGLITRVVQDEALTSTASEIAGELASGATIALSHIRQMTWAALESSFDDELDRERKIQRLATGTEDYKEGVKAFLEKRPSQFKGR